jgi:hypothetical protein
MAVRPAVNRVLDHIAAGRHCIHRNCYFIFNANTTVHQGEKIDFFKYRPKRPRHLVSATRAHDSTIAFHKCYRFGRENACNRFSVIVPWDSEEL